MNRSRINPWRQWVRNAVAEVNAGHVGALIGAFFSSGCAVTTSFDQGQMVERSIGFVSAKSDSCTDGNTLIHRQIFGFGLDKSGAVLGFEEDEVICLPLESCVAVFVIRNSQEAEAIRNLIPDLDNGCLINSQKRTKHE